MTLPPVCLIDADQTVFAQERQIIDMVNAAVAGRETIDSLIARRDELMQLGVQTESPGYRQLACWLDVMLAELADDSTAIKTQTHRLYQELIAYDEWTAFEYSLIITVVPYLAFEQVQFLFGKFVEVNQEKGAVIPTNFDNDMDTLYLGLLSSALLSGTDRDIVTAAHWIDRRPVSNKALHFRLYQRFADAVIVSYEDSVAAGQTAFETLLTEVNELGLCKQDVTMETLIQTWMVLQERQQQRTHV